MLSQIGLSIDFNAFYRECIFSAICVLGGVLGFVSCILLYVARQYPVLACSFTVASEVMLAAALVVWPWYRHTPGMCDVLTIISTSLPGAWAICNTLKRRCSHNLPAANEGYNEKFGDYRDRSTRAPWQETDSGHYRPGQE